MNIEIIKHSTIASPLCVKVYQEHPSGHRYTASIPACFYPAGLLISCILMMPDTFKFTSNPATAQQVSVRTCPSFVL